MIQRIRDDIAVALGRSQADLVLSHGRFLDVFTGEIREGDLAIRAGFIVGMGPIGTYQGKKNLNLEGRIVVPGLIDSHVHIESSLLAPPEFAALTVPCGTTTVVADPHEIANVCGMEGIHWLLAASENLPQSVFVMLPSCVPATSFEDAGAVLEADDLATLMNHPRVLGLGEVMDYPAVIAAQKGILDKMTLAGRAGKKIDGHSPALGGKDLQAYAVAGVNSDHECSHREEMQERLRLGMRVFIREGTTTRDLSVLIGGVSPAMARRCSFCSDDKLPGDISAEGHMDFNIRKAITLGFDPVEAIRLATLNAAEAFGLEDRGALCPGRYADFVILDSELADFRPGAVYRRGVLVAQGGALIDALPTVDHSLVRDTLHPAPFSLKDLKLRLHSGLTHVIRMRPGSLITEDKQCKVPRDSQGNFSPEAGKDFLKIVVVERHKKTGLVGLGIVEGYGLQGGAVASSIAHDSHNLVAIGDDDAALLACLRALKEAEGGIALASTGGELMGLLALPLGGLMTDAPAKKTIQALDKLVLIARKRLHVPDEINPFMALSFLALPVIPDLKITARGLFDVKNFNFIKLQEKR